MLRDVFFDGWEARFGGVARLYGAEAARVFREAKVCVIGLGGVGSWAVEALARSGAGGFLLVDPDDICVTNTNRQIHAVEGAAGMSKAEAMAARVRLVNPDARVETRAEFAGAENAGELINTEFACVIDAVDRLSAKCAIIARCREAGVPVVTAGGAGGRLDASQVRVGDLGEAWGDDLLRLVRKKLRRDYGFPRGEGVRFGVRCVFSAERQRFPWSDGRVCGSPEPGASVALDCATGFGTACHVTAVFGMLAAGEALKLIAAAAGIQ